MSDPADSGLAYEQFDDLNRRFYGAKPYDYFSHRLNSLLVMLGRSEDVQRLFEEGIQFGDLKVEGGTVEGPQDEIEQDKMNYATAESVVLLHHVSESLLRLFFAHEYLPRSPWLEVARLRNFRKFKEKVSGFLDMIGRDDDVGQDLDTRLLKVFRGTSRPDGIAPAVSSDEWKDKLRALRMLLEDAASRMIREAPMYNATKHGFAVRPGHHKVSLTVPNETKAPELGNAGQAIAYLERRHPAGEKPYWAESVTFVHLEQYLALTFMLIKQMESLWNVAKARYTRDGDEPKLAMPGTSTVQGLLQFGVSEPYHVSGMSMSLAYYSVEGGK